jgi:hypothetical protein
MTASRALHAALWAAGAFAAAYLLQGSLHLPAVLYDPVSRTLSVGALPSGVQMRFYSDLGGAALAALAAALVRLQLGPGRFDPLVLAASALGLVAIDVAFFFSRVLAAAR